MIIVLALLGSILAASGTIPYIIETAKGKAKPRIVSWLTWTLLMGMATAGAFADHQVGSAMFSLLGAAATGSIVLAGLRYGDRSFKALDIICMVGVIIGLILWQLFNNPAIAVWAAINVDFIGLIPTLKHAWDMPREETLTTYILVCAGGFLNVGANATDRGWSVTSVGYPLYAAVSMGMVALIILIRGKVRLKDNSPYDLSKN